MSIRSTGIVFGFVLLPMFMVSVLGNKILQMIEKLATGIFAGSLSNAVIGAAQNAILFNDLLIIFIFTLFVGRILLKSFTSQLHPVFGIVGLFALPVVVYVVAMFSNALSVFTDIGFLQSSVNDFGLSYQLFSNSPLIASVVGVVTVLVMIGGARLRR